MNARDDLLNVNAVAPIPVEVPGRGTYYVKGFVSVTDLFNFQRFASLPEDEQIVRQLVAVLVNQDGTPVFSEEDVPALMKQNVAVLLPVWKAVSPVVSEVCNVAALVEDEEKKS